jgi:geranylgeranyl pyrophosphate synthase
MKAFSEISPRKTESDLHDFFAESRARVDEMLDRLLPQETAEPKRVHSAIRWSVFAGGKRFRPALVLAVGETLAGLESELLRTACAFEMIHTYSLIHDDLPAMDDDDLRRGRPTCHVRFGDATAILAGDGLQTLAFKTIADDDNLPPETRVRVILELANASGTPDGMVAGQAFDLDAESKAISGSELERIHHFKTGAIINAAVRSGAIIANATDDDLDSLSRYATQLGLLFQITDDLLDVTASIEDLGKTPGKDARSRKATYPALYGIEATKTRAREVYDEACRALGQLEQPAGLLHEIARFILERRA